MESEPPQRWAATYTKQVKQKRKAYQDGALLLYPASGRLVLLDDAGDTLESRFLRSSEEISAGAALSFQAHLVDVGEPEEDGPVRYTSSSASASAAAGSRNARRGGGARSRPPSSGRGRVFPPHVPRTFVNPSSKSHGCDDGGEGEAAGSGRADVAESKFQEWTALYTAQLTQKAKKYHDGFVRLVQIGPQAKQIVLLDEDEQVLCSRHLKSGESVESGKKCHFPNYLVDICEAKNQNKEHTSEESMVHTKPMNGKSTSNKMGMCALSKSQKFISPHPQKNHDLENTDSEVTASSGKAETENAEAVSADQPGSLIQADSNFKEWNALYTTQLTQKSKKYHDGIIRLVQIGSHARQIVLLDEYGEELCSRYLKSVESVESGKRFQMPAYLIDVCEFRNQKNEPRHSSKEALSQTGLRNEENTSDKLSGKSKSPKFVSPFKCQDLRKSHWESTTSSNRPRIGPTSSNLDAPPNFNDLRKSHWESTASSNRPQIVPTSSTLDALPNFNDLRKSHWESTTSSNRPQIGPTSSNLDAPPNFNDPWSKSDCNVNRRADCSESALGIMDDPLKFSHIQRATATNPCPAFGKLSSTRDLPQFHDLQAGCPRSFDRREVGKSTFGNMDHSVRTASQILSIMKPPSEVRISQSAPSGQAHSLASSVSRTAVDVNCRKNSVADDSNRSFGGRETSGTLHFATQLRSSIQTCLNLETLPRKNSGDHQWIESSGNNYSTYDDPNIRRPASFGGQDLAMVDTLASNMSNAKGQKPDSSNQHSGSSSDKVPVMNNVTDTGFHDGRSGTADQLTTQNSSRDETSDDPPSTSAYTLTCKDPKIQALIDDCPSFDLGF